MTVTTAPVRGAGIVAATGWWLIVDLGADGWKPIPIGAFVRDTMAVHAMVPSPLASKAGQLEPAAVAYHGHEMRIEHADGRTPCQCDDDSGLLDFADPRFCQLCGGHRDDPTRCQLCGRHRDQ